MRGHRAYELSRIFASAPNRMMALANAFAGQPMTNRHTFTLSESQYELLEGCIADAIARLLIRGINDSPKRYERFHALVDLGKTVGMAL